ncbi:MAG: molybdenum cofactor biosynthesis protein, partial [Marinobacter sp.]|nr:molybdenum cofactor biosynthesis protein [Marinobacter sp.]
MSSELTGELKPLNIALLTVSDSRGPNEDTSGQFLEDSILEAGHNLTARRLLPDDVYLVRALISGWIADPQ